jgi:hypothetical protein
MSFTVKKNGVWISFCYKLIFQSWLDFKMMDMDF